MKAITFIILMAVTSTALANDGIKIPNFATQQEPAIVSTELIVLRFKNLEAQESPQEQPKLVAPLSLLWDWSKKEEGPQIYRPFILIKE
tara:strand:- start:825 stop:1091 length:267 start_codon:yes stop_codon:yes gene_type:complete